MTFLQLFYYLLVSGICYQRYYLLVFSQSPIVVEDEDWYDACMYVYRYRLYSIHAFSFCNIM